MNLKCFIAGSRNASGAEAIQAEAPFLVRRKSPWRQERVVVEMGFHDTASVLFPIPILTFPLKGKGTDSRPFKGRGINPSPLQLSP